MDQFFRNFKTEWMPKAGYGNFTQAEIDMVAYIQHDNYQRGHSYNNS